MPNEIVCPRCERVNDEQARFCTRCSRSLADVREAVGEDPNAQRDEASEDGQDVHEELVSVRKQLTEATDLLGSLYSRVTRLEARISRDADVGQPERGDEGAAVEQQPAAVTESASVAVTSAAEAVSQETPDTLEPLRYRAPEAPEIAFRIDWEQVLGRNWFAIIGGIAVVLGIGFFLKLAFDNNWINDIGRIALGVVVGIGFLGVGEYAQRKVPRWAQAVTASGTAILYLTIYAAFGLYQLISPTAAFLLLAVVVTVAVLLALRYESLVIALLGLVGAFISPVLLGPDLPDERLALVYILIVDVGILAISTFRNWRWLTLVGLAGSYGIFAYWMIEVSDFNPVFAQIALTGIFLTFAAATPLFHILWRRMPGATDLSLMSLNAIAYFALTTAILWDDYKGWFGLIAFSLTALYGLIALAAFKRSGAPARIAVFALGIAAVFLTMAFPLQFSGYSVAVAWAAQGVVMVWMSFYLGRWQTRAFGVVVLALAICHLLLFDIWVDAEAYTPILNGRFATIVVAIAAFYATGVIYRRNRNSDGQFKIERWAVPTMLGIANLLTLALLSLEIVNFQESDRLSWTGVFGLGRTLDFESGTHLMLTLLWAGYGTAVVAAGMLRRYEPARWGGLAVLGVAVWKLLTYDTFLDFDPITFTPLLNLRFLTLALVLGLLSVLAYRFRRDESVLIMEREAFVFPALLIAANVVALCMLSQEVIYYFDSLEERRGGDYFSAMHLSLTVLWAVYSMGAISAGIASQSSRVRLAGMGLLAIPVAKLFVYDVFLLDLAYRVAAFITLGCMLLGMGLVYQRYGGAVRGFLFGPGAGAGRDGG